MDKELIMCIAMYVIIFLWIFICPVIVDTKEKKKMAREGLFDDTGYRGFDECTCYEDCSKEAYDKGRDDMAEETYLNLITEIDLLNASDMAEVNLYKFACKVKEIAEGLKWQNRGQNNDKK